MFRSELHVFWRLFQSSKDSTSPMSETCKNRTGQVKFQDRKPDWAYKIVESKLNRAKQTRIPFLKGSGSACDSSYL